MDFFANVPYLSQETATDSYTLEKARCQAEVPARAQSASHSPPRLDRGIPFLYTVRSPIPRSFAREAAAPQAYNQPDTAGCSPHSSSGAPRPRLWLSRDTPWLFFV